MDRLVDYQRRGRAVHLTLNSPHNRNALSTALVTQLHQGLDDAVADPDAWLVVLGHTGGTFCAGADLAQAAGRYYLTGETFAAAEAAASGLITIAADDVGAALTELTESLKKGSPQGLAASKALTTAAMLAGFDRDADRLTQDSARLFVSEEAREGMLAFLQKRPPKWTETDD